MKILIFFIFILKYTLVFSEDRGQFSPELMFKLGLNEDIVNQLKTGDIKEGKSFITIYINGYKFDTIELDFKNKNNFYIDKIMIKKMNLKDLLLDEEKALFKTLYPKSKIIYENEELNVFIPSNYFKESEKEKQLGKGGFVNYRLDYDQELINKDNESAENIFSGDLIYGLNYDGYLFRGTVNYNNVNNKAYFNYNYLQKNFIDKKTLGRIGDVFTLNPFHGGVDLVGIQYKSDNYFLSSSNVRIDGNVTTQTRVEVYISDDILIHRETVPPGYYEFNNITLPFSANTLRVVERGSDGSFNERQVLVQQTSFNFSEDAEFSVTAGYANNSVSSVVEDTNDIINNDNNYNDWIISGYSDIYKNNNHKILGSFLIGDDYYFSGIGYSKNIENSSFYLKSYNIETGFNYSNDDFEDGYYSAGAINFSTGNQYGLNLFTRYESKSFRQLENDPSDFKQQMSTSLYTPFILFDHFSVSYSQTYYHENKSDHSVNVTLQKKLYNNSYLNVESYYDSNDEWSVNLFLSIPITFTDSISYVDLGYLIDREEDQYELSVNGEKNGYKYNASSNYYKEEGESTGSINIDKNYKNIYASVGTFITEEGFDNIYGSLEGGFAFSSNGHYDFTPEEIGDTFAFVKIDEHDDIKIITSGADAITSDGVAVISSLNPYVNNSIEIDTKTLPENVTLKNGYKEIYLSYGSIAEVKIETKPFYNSLIKLINEKGEDLSINYVILNQEDEFITMVGFDGLVFFETETENILFKAKSQTTECSFSLEDKKIKDENSNINIVVCH